MKTTHTWASLNPGDVVTFQNVLLQSGGGFGVQSYTCKEVELICRPYAQYPKALEARFLEKGKRNRRGFTIYGDQAFVLVVPQVAAAAPADPFEPGVVSGGMVTQSSRYACFDSRYLTDHMAMLDAAGVSPLFFLYPPADGVAMPTEAEVITRGESGFERRVVPIADLGSVAEVVGVCESRSVRLELQGQPTLKGFCGPMWSGGLIRYESAAANEVLSV